LESPEHHRTPHHVRIARLGVSVPPVPPPIAPIMPPLAPIYSHLPAHLAEQYAALPPLQPTRRQASVVPPPPPQLAPAFEPAPAPARFRYLPADLAQRVAALPPLIQRGRGRGRGNNITAPAPLPFTEIAAQYAALPPVCVIFFNL
jgi:hypothetical protein